MLHRFRFLTLLALAGLLGMVASMGVAQASPDSIAICCAWNSNLDDGDLTYKISGGDTDVQEIVRIAVEEWEAAVVGLTLTEVTGRTKPNVDIKFKRGGGMVQGQALRSFDNQGFVTAVKINISGKAFGDPNEEDTVAQIGKHEFGHALGLGHADFAGDLMSTSVSAGTGDISDCDVDGVLEANHWKLVDATTPHAPHVTSLSCGPPPAPLAHDVAVTGVTAPSTAVVGATVGVSVTVENQGTTDPETFDVKLTDTTANVLIRTEAAVSLDSGASTTVSFSWSTTGASLGDHVLQAEAVLAGDEDTADNTGTATVTLTDGTVTVYHVHNMGFDVNKKGPWYNLKATMTIKDADEATAPEGVTVTGTISREGRTFNYNQTTNASGQVQFKLKTQLIETLYTVQVTDVEDGAGGAFNSTPGEPCKTIIIHNDATFTEDTCA